MMTNVESSTEKLLQIVLVGQPELEQLPAVLSMDDSDFVLGSSMYFRV